MNDGGEAGVGRTSRAQRACLPGALRDDDLSDSVHRRASHRSDENYMHPSPIAPTGPRLASPPPPPLPCAPHPRPTLAPLSPHPRPTLAPPSPHPQGGGPPLPRAGVMLTWFIPPTHLWRRLYSALLIHTAAMTLLLPPPTLRPPSSHPPPTLLPCTRHARLLCTNASIFTSI